MRYKAREIRFGKEADKGGVFKKYPPQCSKVIKDSDAYRLCSYERQERTMSLSLQKKLDTARPSELGRTQQTIPNFMLQSWQNTRRLQTITPPTTSGIGKPRKAA